jgi:hypothetical protein
VTVDMSETRKVQLTVTIDVEPDIRDRYLADVVLVTLLDRLNFAHSVEVGPSGVMADPERCVTQLGEVGTPTWMSDPWARALGLKPPEQAAQCDRPESGDPSREWQAVDDFARPRPDPRTSGEITRPYGPPRPGS